jgi:glycogen synthase kinase 3 beta
MDNETPNLVPVKVKGHGTFGYVFKAVDEKTGEKVAVKRVRKAEDKVSREFKVLDVLRDTKECVELKNMFYTKDDKGEKTQNFVFEYVPDSLEQFICQHQRRDKHIPLLTIKSIMKQILKGFVKIHEKGICHRDLKPDNILLTHDKQVKICDFGSAKFLNDKNIPHIVSQFYRPPELLLLHHQYDTKVDMWVIGCILVELFTLTPLFRGKMEGLQIMEQITLCGNFFCFFFRFFADFLLF